MLRDVVSQTGKVLPYRYHNVVGNYVYLIDGVNLQVKTEKYEYDWGIIVNFRTKTGKGKKIEKENPLTAETNIIVDILLHVKKSDDDEKEKNIPCPPGEVIIN